MELKLKFPSLRSIAGVKLAVSLWTSREATQFLEACEIQETHFSKTWRLTHDFRRLIEMDDIRDEKGWQELKETLYDHVENFLLPEKLKLTIKILIEPIGRDILRWMRKPHLQCKKFSLARPRIHHYLRSLQWTPDGYVDRKAMMMLLLDDDEIPTIYRFELACNLCLGEKICELWKKLRTKASAKAKAVRSKRHEYDLVLFWKYCLEGHLEILDRRLKAENPTSNPYKEAFKVACLKSNISGMEYFWGKLSNQEQERMYPKLAKRTIYFNGRQRSSYLGFINNNFRSDQRVKVFIHQPFQIILSLLEWPHQDLFIEFSKKMWDVIEHYDYFSLLTFLANSAKKNLHDKRYLFFFELIWLDAPAEFNEFVLRHEAELVYLLLMLNELPTDKYACMLLVELEKLPNRERFSANSEFLLIFKTLILNSKWDMLDLYLRVCVMHKGLAALIFGQMECHFRNWPNDEIKDKWTHIASPKLVNRFLELTL